MVHTFATMLREEGIRSFWKGRWLIPPYTPCQSVDRAVAHPTHATAWTFRRVDVELSSASFPACFAWCSPWCANPCRCVDSSSLSASFLRSLCGVSSGPQPAARDTGDAHNNPAMTGHVASQILWMSYGAIQFGVCV